MKLTNTIIDTMARFEPRKDYFADIGLSHSAVHDAILDDYPESSPEDLKDIDVLLTIERILDCSGVPYGLRLNDGLPLEMMIGGATYKVCKYINSNQVVLTESKYGRSAMTANYNDSYDIARLYDGDYDGEIRFSYSTQCNIRAIRICATEVGQ